MESCEISNSSIGIGDSVCLLSKLDEILMVEWGYGLLRIELLKMVSIANLHKSYNGQAAIGNGTVGDWLEDLRISGGSIVEYNALTVLK